MQHFILSQPLDSDKVRIFDRAVLQQMTKVLRFRKGDKCIVMDGKGSKAKATVEELHSKVAMLGIYERSVLPPPLRRLRLYCALPKKPATFEWVLQKATELGVTDLIPLITDRCQVKELRKRERLLAIIKEACEQSEHAFMPILHPLVSLKDFLRQLPSGIVLAGDPWTYDKALKDIPLKPKEDVNLIIGPEGGLSPEELENIRAAGGVVFLLGPHVLRMETAALASLAVIQYA